MARIRISTTVDGNLLDQARQVRRGDTDAALIDEALQALLSRHQAARIDRQYRVYEQQPLEEPDAWGDLASFRDAASTR